MKARYLVEIGLVLLGFLLGYGFVRFLEPHTAHLVRVHGSAEKGCLVEWESSTSGPLAGGVLDGEDTFKCGERFRAGHGLTLKCVCP